MAPIAAVVVVVVVLAMLGVATFALTGGFNKVLPPSCQPAASPICTASINKHDVNVLMPYRTVQEGTSVPITASLPSGETVSSFSYLFGDGLNVSSRQATQSHIYTVPGIYLLEVQANVGGVIHDNIEGLIQVVVTATFAANTQGQLPSVSGSILANTTTTAAQKGATAALQPAQTVTLSASYTAAPSNPQFLAIPPKFVVPTALTVVSKNVTSTNGTVTVRANTPGTFQVTFAGGSTSGNTTAYQNFTWNVLVPPAGVHAGVAGLAQHTSPHKGTIVAYELVPGGGASEDPAIDYETAGAEPIFNVYQTLLAYNGTQAGPDPTAFVPQLATCVPGSAECQALYPNTPLVQGWNYTFVIQPNASFYDPLTQKSWGVWPTDVVFSIARTLGFANLPCVSCNNGWIIAQSLLNSGNSTWSNLHGSYNNTPGNILGSMTINGTGCPTAGLDPTKAHGCVTFNVYGSHHAWPYFLELLADPLGGSIVPCGWFSASAQGAGIPFWTQGNVSGAGDHPCAAAGTPGWGIPANSIPATGWDQWEQLGSGAFGTYAGHVQYNMVGSGPYALQQYLVGSAYTLEANPAYGQNPYCTWVGCQPAPGTFAKVVSITWETSQTPGEQAAVSGSADFASIPSTDIALLLELIQQGKFTSINAPTITIGFYPFNMDFNLGGAQKYTSNPISVPSDWFSYQGMRQLFSRAYLYATVENTINTKDGLVLGFDYGGAIPQYMGNYYPTNISWPNADPCSDNTNPTCPAYWWTQMRATGGPYFDPEAAKCSSANPCELPIFGATGSAANDQVLALWAQSVNSITGGAVVVHPVDINFIDIILNSLAGPYQNALPMYTLGWAPDYPDPTDYIAPLYLANSTYTYGDAVMQSLWKPQFVAGCGQPVTNYPYFANTAFPQNCQGVAYKSMLYVLGIAATAPIGPNRVLLYNFAEKIAEQLGLYTYSSQGNLIKTCAAWVDPNSLNTNITIGGGGDELFYNVHGNGVAG
ncbi:MAG TPA: ABC transporter substrate-binding protein [Thermoplasmata archaeon]|nr:ABC transporter substrate-binding protein [Thermoplasmata archaeon]